MPLRCVVALAFFVGDAVPSLILPGVRVLQLIELTEKALIVISSEYSDTPCEKHVDKLHHLIAEHEACYL